MEEQSAEISATELFAIEELSPIPQILDYACPPKTKVRLLYKNFLQVQIPVLIGLATNFDYCFNGVIRLCQDSRDQTIRYCPGYEDLIVKCRPNEARFLLYLVDLNFKHNQGTFQGRHGEAIIIDTQEKTIEFFEPNGSYVAWYPFVSSFLENALVTQYPGYRFISTSDFCPLLGPQGLAKVPFCAAFSLLYLILRIHNPQFSSKDIIDIWLELPREALIILIEAFICYADEYSKYYNLRRLQDVYDNLSSIFQVSFPEILPTIDQFYLDFSLDGLLNLAQDYDIDL